MVHAPSSKPSILVIPGAACPSRPFYQPLCDKLSAVHGYKAQTADLQSASRAPPQTPATLEEDAGFFKEILTRLADHGEDVVVVAHSYGGMVATDAVQGLAKADREAQGQAGGVVKLVYLTCMVPGLGETGQEVFARGNFTFKMNPVGEVCSSSPLPAATVSSS
jgi:pimeloyl-ACP methyl ester carboxylesterase